MSAPLDLDRLRRATPHCAGIAWFAGTPLRLVSSSGTLDAAEWPSWDAVGKVAPLLLHDGPVASPEVLLRLPAAMLLLAERPTGVAVIVLGLTNVSIGMALVQARMAAAQVSP